MANAMVALATITLGSSASTVTFGSIPATYRDLRLVVDLTPSGSLGEIYARLNTDSGSNYPVVEAGGNGSTTFSGAYTLTGGLIGYLSGSGKTVIEANVMDYSATDKHKTIVSRQSTSTEVAAMRFARWANTGIVTSLTFACQAGSFASGTTVSLYGIVSA